MAREVFIKPKLNYRTLHQDLNRQLREIPALSVNRRIMETYAEVRLQMRAPRGTGVMSDSDTIIEATALRHNLTLVTANEREFKRVPGLNAVILTTQ